MKILYISLKKLQGHLNENRFISIVYILSYCLCIFTFIYVYNNYMPNITREAVNRGEYRYYSFEFEQGICDMSILDSVLDQYNINYVTYYHLSADNGIYAAAFDNDDIMTELAEGRIYFTENERSTFSQVAILPGDSEILGSRPQSCVIDDIKFKAVGLHCGSDVLIPVIYFKEGILSCDKVEVYLENTLTHEENEQFIDSICKLGKVNFTRSPVDMYETEKAAAQNVLIEITSGFIAIMLIFRYLISYIITENMKENVIYRLVGADTYTISLVMIIDIVITNIILAIITCIMHKLLFNVLFNKLNYYKQLDLEINDYLLIIGITSLFSFLLLLPKLINASKKTVIQVGQDV